jgi:nitrite reductase/ring-hydroxylating ferredoxin subunit
MTDAPSPRPRAQDTPAGVALCRLDELADPGARGFVLQIGEAYFHGFVVRRAEAVRGYVDRCPHAGLPLPQALDVYLTVDGSLIQCSWHGALFRIEDGLCVGGPCGGARLRPWPVRVEDGRVMTA